MNRIDRYSLFCHAPDIWHSEDMVTFLVVQIVRHGTTSKALLVTLARRVSWHSLPTDVNKNRNSGLWKLLRTIHQLVQHAQSGWKNFARMWSSNCLFGTIERENILILFQTNARHCRWKHTTSQEWKLNCTACRHFVSKTANTPFFFSQSVSLTIY